MRFLITLCLIASLATVAWTSSSSWGKRGYNDYLLYREIVVRRPQNGYYQSVNVLFPKAGQGNTRNISAVFVIDNFRNSSGAQPSLWNGGPGYKFVSLNLKSRYSEGIDSKVEIYGK